jgi:hypothetical protein
MNRQLLRVWAFALAAGILAVSHKPAARAQNRDATTPIAMTLDVDATDAPMKIIHATMSMPARAADVNDLLTAIAAPRKR